MFHVLFLVFAYHKYPSMSVDFHQTASVSETLPRYFTVNTKTCHWQGHLGELEKATATQSVEVLGETNKNCREQSYKGHVV